MPDRTPRAERRVDLLFDKDCGFCVWSVGWLHRLDRRGRVTATPLHAPGAVERFGVSVDQALEQAWAVDWRGDRHHGAGAINAALSGVLGTRIPLRVYRIPGIRQVQDRLYRLVARNRHRLPGSGGSCAIE
ncbi:thiol-disulfide oxidoreductase DCC family protein [Rhodococcus sp. NPDC058505]|uniref:thiol-disulfide oxidoreductase DCC family protein n=1 Tax=unclassified Rhodococcus (in: high G+C Gram-positive bacteria) TaxID=192944 RepID=UPI003652F3FF